MEDYNRIFASIDAGRTLDVASGNGYFLELLLTGARSYSEAVGVDMKEAAAGPFGETFKDNSRVSFKVMDGAKLDFADASFDTVSISHSLHHIQDPAAVLKEMYRVLRPGGNFIINEMFCDGTQTETQKTHILLHHWMGIIDTAAGVYHRETYKREELLGFARTLGLQNLTTHDIADLGDDPMSVEVQDEIAPVIDRYAARVADQQEMLQIADSLRQRLKKVGFHSATTLLILAKK
jgi:SAM-dependent methyltransferase